MTYAMAHDTLTGEHTTQTDLDLDYRTAPAVELLDVLMLGSLGADDLAAYTVIADVTAVGGSRHVTWECTVYTPHAVTATFGE